MAYVRKKKVKGREYFQVVESYRKNGKPRQRVLAYMGDYPTVDAALEGLPGRVALLRRVAEKQRKPGRGWLRASPRRLERAGRLERRADILQGRLEKLEGLRAEDKGL